jgi:hypothetical protein
VKNAFLTCLAILSFLTCAAARGNASASSGAGAFAPQLAVDGDFGTRWASDMRDNEWWQLALTPPQYIAGLTIFWETAYAERYHVDVADGDTNWHTVYATNDGDGNVDRIFFAPVTAAFVRVVCARRATGWGNSIYELELLPAAQVPRITATPCGADTAAIMDGATGTVWRAAAPEASVTLAFAAPIELSGLTIISPASQACAVQCQSSTDGAAWTPVAPWHALATAQETMLFAPLTTRWLRIACSGAVACAIAELDMVCGSRLPSIERMYHLRARGARRGMLPLWTARRQEFWTITGVEGHEQELLLSEFGLVEPRKNGPCMQPFLLIDGTVVTYADAAVTQALEDGDLPLPRVTWQTNDWQLTIRALAAGTATTACGLVTYELQNDSARVLTAALALVVRPLQLNPPWQHGGGAPITAAEWQPATDDRMMLICNGAPFMLCPTTALQRCGAQAWQNADAGDAIFAGSPIQRGATDRDGMASAAALFSFVLAPGARARVPVALPLDDTRDAVNRHFMSFDALLRDARQHWQSVTTLNGFAVPDPALAAFARSALAYIALTRDAALFKPGPRNYNHTWMRDGAITSVALLRYNRPAPVREFIMACQPLLATNGWVPFLILETGRPAGSGENITSGEGQEYDSQGEYVHMVRQYVAYTGDTNLLVQIYPTVRRALAFAHAMRRRRMTDAYRSEPDKQPYFGLLPESNSHEGYFPARHSYWDDFWVLRGLRDGAALAHMAGHADDARWMRAETADLLRCITASISTVVARAQIAYVPGCVELADFDATSTAIALSACDAQDAVPLALLTNTFARYLAYIHGRIHEGKPDTFTPYEARNVDALVRLGRRAEARALLHHLVNACTRPRAWNHLAEVVHADPRSPAYIGDMPHTWVGADVLNAIRTLFVYEARGTLVLGAGLDPAWIARGVAVTNLPTPFGAISFQLVQHGDAFTFLADGTARPPRGFRVMLPWPVALAQTTANVVCTNTHLSFARLPVQCRGRIRK